MTNRWTAHHPRSVELLNAPGFEAEVGQRRGLVNGDLSRTNLPAEEVTRAMLLPNAFHKVLISQDIILPSGQQNSLAGAGQFKCLWYTDYSGGWVGQDYSFTGLLEGVLHIEFSCWYWQEGYYAMHSPKSNRFRILVNGLLADESPNMHTPWGNTYLTADVPISGGDVTITVQWRYTAPVDGEDSVTLDEFLFAGGNLLAIARHR